MATIWYRYSFVFWFIFGASLVFLLNPSSSVTPSPPSPIPPTTAVCVPSASRLPCPAAAAAAAAPQCEQCLPAVDYPVHQSIEIQRKYAASVCRKAYTYECPLPNPEDLSDQQVRQAFARMYSGFLDLQEAAQQQRWNHMSAFLAERIRLGGNMGHANGMYGVLDSFVLYSLMRLYKTAQVLEIGSGESTFQASLALDMNERDNATLTERRHHFCVEPYRNAAIQSLVSAGKVTTVLTTVQKMPVDIADRLEAGDLLFIDSSHVVTPLGDTLFEYLLLLPRLNAGVLVHIHDIFLPWNYHSAWQEIRPYTEQWALALFLHNNADWEVIFATTLMLEKHPKLFSSIPGVGGGGNFFMQKKMHSKPLRSFDEPALSKYT